MLTALSHGGYRVVAFDQRGQYQSDRLAKPAAYSMRMFTDDLLGVIKVVGNGHPVHLLGHSFGGLVARRVAITAPSFVRSLTLLDSGPDGTSLSVGAF
jgi:pimeloyl-ACP methyl ester carboxylesterase